MTDKEILNLITEVCPIEDSESPMLMAFQVVKVVRAALNKVESSSRIIERSQPELNTKMKRLMDAVTKLHPTLAMDDPKHEELYLSLHSLKESVTSL